MTNLLFKKLEKQIYLRYNSDGFIDMAAGGMLLGFGIFMAVGNAALLVLSWLPLLIYFPLKKAVTMPRIGYIQFHTPKKRARHLSLSLAAGLLLLALLFVLTQVVSSPGRNLRELMQANLMLFLALLFAAMMCTAAALTKNLRILAYAGLTVLITGGGSRIGLSEPASVILNGSLLFLAGLFFLIRFLRTYPIPENGEEHV